MALDDQDQTVEAMDHYSDDKIIPTTHPLASIDPLFQNQHVLAAVSLATKSVPAKPAVKGPHNTKQLPASPLDYHSYLYLKSQEAPAGAERRDAAEAAVKANWHRIRNVERTRALREGRKDKINYFREGMIGEAKRVQAQRAQVVERRKATYRWKTDDTYSDSGTDSGEKEEEEAEELQLSAGYALPQCQCKGGDWCWWCP